MGLKLKNNKELSITNLYKEELFFEKNEYHAIIHKITLNKNSKQLKLQFYSKDKKNIFNLNRIELKTDKEKIIFEDLGIKNEDMPKFLNYYRFSFNNKNINNKNISIILESSKKLEIYFNYFKNQENIDNDLKKILVKQSFLTLKSNNKINFSLIIEIFNLCFETKLIIDFLDNYPKLNYQLNDKIESKKFNDILNIYKNDKKNFFEKNVQFFNEIKKDNKKVDKYKKLLENFITIYQLFYEDSTKIEKTRLKEVKPTLISLINNKNDIISYIKFILYKLNSIYMVLNSSNKDKILKVSVDLIEKAENKLYFQDFENIYNKLVEEQVKIGFILDFENIFNYSLKGI